MGKHIPTVASADTTSHLLAERDAWAAFIALLETEQQSLTSGDADQLLALADRKMQAAQGLSKLENMRRNELLAHGVAIDSDSIRSWLLPQGQKNQQLWHEIQQLAARAQQLNLTNGALIQTKLLHNQQALAVLHNAANSAHGLYGPDGQPHLKTSARTLGSV